MQGFVSTDSNQNSQVRSGRSAYQHNAQTLGDGTNRSQVKLTSDNGNSLEGQTQVFASIFDAQGNEVIAAEAKLAQGIDMDGRVDEGYPFVNETEHASPIIRPTNETPNQDALPFPSAAQVKQTDGILPQGTDLSFFQRPGQTEPTIGQANVTVTELQANAEKHTTQHSSLSPTTNLSHIPGPNYAPVELKQLRNKDVSKLRNSSAVRKNSALIRQYQTQSKPYGNNKSNPGIRRNQKTHQTQNQLPSQDPRHALDLRTKKSQQEYKFYSILNNQPVHGGASAQQTPSVASPTHSNNKGKSAHVIPNMHVVYQTTSGPQGKPVVMTAYQDKEQSTPGTVNGQINKSYAGWDQSVENKISSAMLLYQAGGQYSGSKQPKELPTLSQISEGGSPMRLRSTNTVYTPSNKQEEHALQGPFGPAQIQRHNYIDEQAPTVSDSQFMREVATFQQNMNSITGNKHSTISNSERNQPNGSAQQASIPSEHGNNGNRATTNENNYPPANMNRIEVETIKPSGGQSMMNNTRNRNSKERISQERNQGHLAIVGQNQRDRDNQPTITTNKMPSRLSVKENGDRRGGTQSQMSGGSPTQKIETLSVVTSPNSGNRKPIRIGQVVTSKGTKRTVRELDNSDLDLEPKTAIPRQAKLTKRRQSQESSCIEDLAENTQLDLLCSPGTQDITLQNSQNAEILIAQGSSFDDKNKAMQTLSDSAQSNSDGGASQTFSQDQGEIEEGQREQFGSAAVTRNTFLYGGARIKVDQNLRVKTAEYQHKPENRIRQIHAQYNAQRDAKRGIKKNDLYDKKTKSLINVQTEDGKTNKESALFTHGQTLTASNAQIFNNKLIQDGTQRLDLNSMDENKGTNDMTDTRSRASSVQPYGPHRCKRFLKREMRGLSAHSGSSMTNSPGRLRVPTAYADPNERQAAQIPASGFNSLEPTDFVSQDTLKGTVKVYEITAKGGPALESLRLGGESNRLNEIESTRMGGINIGNLFSVYGPKTNTGVASARNRQSQYAAGSSRNAGAARHQTGNPGQGRRGISTQQQKHRAKAYQNLTGQQGQLLIALKGGAGAAERALSSGAALPDVNVAASCSEMSSLQQLQRLVPNGRVITKAGPVARATSGQYASSRAHSPAGEAGSDGTFDRQQEQVKALKNMFGDGSLNDLLFPGHQPQSDYAFERDSQDDSEGSDDEDKNSLVIKMLGSMLAKKKTNAECQAINKPIDLQKLKEDLREMALSELAARGGPAATGGFSQERLVMCSNLSSQVACNPGDHPAKREKIRQQMAAIKLRESQVNPFYKALDAQRKERNDQLALMAAEEDDVHGLPLPIGDASDSEGEEPLANGTENLFAHTHVDIDEKASNVPQATDRVSEKRIDSLVSPPTVYGGRHASDFNEPSDTSKSAVDPSARSSQAGQEIARPADGQPQDIFTFYQLKIDVPPCLYKRLGDFTTATSIQSDALHKFIFLNWPVLKTKKMQFRIGVDEHGDSFNCIAVSTSKKTEFGNVPLSKCCKMCLNFQFSRSLGGRIVCMESLCSKNPVHTFFYDHSLFQLLFPPRAAAIGNAPDTSQNKRSGQTQLNYKFDKAVSREISMGVAAGRLKNTDLAALIGAEKFQQATLKQTMPERDLMKLVMAMQPKKRTKKEVSERRASEMKNTLNEISRAMGFVPDVVEKSLLGKKPAFLSAEESMASATESELPPTKMQLFATGI